MICRSLFLICFSLFGVASGTARKAFDVAPKKSSVPLMMQKQLSVRGGAAGLGPITPGVAAKTSAVIYTLQGSAFMLAPEAFKPYGIHELDVSQVGAGEYFGAWITAIGVAAYCLFIQDASTKTAIGSGFMVMVIDAWRSILSNSATKCSYKSKVADLAALGHALSAYALLSDQEWATNFVTYWCYFGLANGLFGIVDPSKWTMTWGQDETVAKDTLGVLFHRSACFAISAYGVLCLALLNDVSPYKAFAYANAIFGAHFISANYIANEADKLGMNKALFNFWIVVFTIVTMSLLLE